MTARTHRLKAWPEYFQAVESGAKTFELRVDDRSYAVGDTLILREWDPTPELPGLAKGYTGRTLERIVTYKMPGGRFGLGEHMCILALRDP